MSTTPVTPAPATPAKPTTSVPPVTTIASDITWVRTHLIVALLAVALIAGSIIGGVALFEGLIERHDARVAAAQLQKEGVDTATQSALLAQLSQAQAANAQRDAEQTALLSSLVSQMKQQHAATDKQVAADASLTAQDSAARLVAQTKSSPGDAVASGDTVVLSLPLTHTVVTDLDLLPQAQADVSNLTGQLSATKVELTDAMSAADAANLVIAADKAELIEAVKADNAACKVQVDAQASKDRKRGFWLSLVSFLGGIAVRSAL